MNLKQIFLPIALDLGVMEGFSKFADFLEQIEPNFNEETDWEELVAADKAALILQFSLITKLRVSEITHRLTDKG